MNIPSKLNDGEAMVDMEGELVSYLEEIDRLRLKKRKQKQLLMQYEKNGKEPSEYILFVKIGVRRGKENKIYTKTTINRREKEM